MSALFPRNFVSPEDREEEHLISKKATTEIQEIYEWNEALTSKTKNMKESTD